MIFSMLCGAGDEVTIDFNSSDELLFLELNSSPSAVFTRDDVIELIGLLSQFVDQALDEEI